ncbi:MAG: acyl-CoA thioesterase [Thermus sp.]|uniref:acyl-CoA thioesterase n=2 Tax=Bacteria TaxID=2 RepID=UPI00059DB87E|nr:MULTISPECIES: acyl-CoA thioesterase [unclassified Thermus]MCS6869656.1 acyl-CoA thioesterase [Thermus sp.]MCS7219322.1 acyl-CoA thioesterase [Thermus sp.]MDW8018406.1 acyl-CoA thioesterase [Thermus sp.]MDW8358799.1 acyl-CoA thioesterase [Thermus sp.]
MVHLVFPGETNHYGTLFGGTVMAWMDQAAFVAATRHARRKVVTVHSDAVDFQRPVPLGSIVELVARVVGVGRTSMRVAVELWVEPLEGDRYLAAKGGFVLVALDGEGRPAPVPPLEGVKE